MKSENQNVGNETKWSSQKYVLKLSWRLPFNCPNWKTHLVIYSTKEFPKDKKIISCSTHQIPRLLWEFYNIGLLKRKAAYQLSRQDFTSKPGHLLGLLATMMPWSINISTACLSHYQWGGGFTVRCGLLNVCSCCPACKRVGNPAIFLIFSEQLFHKHSLENSLSL